MSHFARMSNAELLKCLDSSMAHEFVHMAEQLDLIGEVDERKAFLDRGYPSMHDYCLGHYRLSDSLAWKRITAARAARRFPQLLGALSKGRLHMTAITLLAPRLTPESVDSLIESATHRTADEIKLMLRPAPAPLPVFPVESPKVPLDSNPVEDNEVFSLNSADLPEPPTFTPAPVRRAVTCMFDEETVALLEQLQDLYSHAVPTRDAAEVLKRCMRAEVNRLRRRKFGVMDKPHMSRTPRVASSDPRYIPAHVKRQVCERDGGQCTFVGDNGHRCGSKHMLEYEHIITFADGGTNTVGNIKLLCRAHDQHAADKRFGRAFMDAKRGARAASGPGAPQLQRDLEDVASALRTMGERGERARRAMQAAASLPSGSVEDRLRAALQTFRPARTVTRRAPAAAAP